MSAGPNEDGKVSVADLFGCRFEGCMAHDGCAQNGHIEEGNFGAGGAMKVGTAADVLIADSVFHGNRAGCLGGALWANWVTPAGPHTINIMSTVFTANHADSGHPGYGNDIAVLATPNQINCPPPGTACGVDLPPGTTCCFEEDYESLSAVLPTSE